MSEHDELWRPTWGQAMTDFHDEDDEAPFDDVTVRMTVPASVGGDRIRAELSNRFGDAPVHIGRAGIGVGEHHVEVTFDGERSARIPAAGSLWTDPVDLGVRHGDDLVVDLYLPDPTPYVSANGFRYDRSTKGDVVGALRFPREGDQQDVDASREFPAVNTGVASAPDGTGWSLPAGGPFLRAIEVAGRPVNAVMACLGGSSTAMGWPQYTGAVLPAEKGIAVVNRGIAGNRIRLDAPVQTPSWGRAGLARFDEDVLGTHGVTHVAVAYNSNDWGLPGRVTPIDEMPTVEQMIQAYEDLVARVRDAGLVVVLATVTPLQPELATDPLREGMRQAINGWIRASGHPLADFDAVLRSESDPSRLAAEYAAPDDTHPNIDGEKRLARTMADTLERLGL